jgi:hypothetical protein
MYTPGIIFLCFIVFCVGAAIGGMVQGGLKKRSATPSPAPATLPAKETSLAKSGDVKVFSAWRTGANQVWLDMDGRRIESKEALQPEQAQRLLGLVLDLRPWLDTNRPALTPQPAGQSMPEPAAPVQPDKINNVSAPAGEVTKPVVALESIIEQIDKVLQKKLSASAFKERGIRLMEGPGGIVMVKDGLNKFEGIDNVPDPEIRTLIRLSVTEWEKSAK